MSLMRIRLELARTDEAPSGDPQHGYEFVAPLSREGHIDATQWHKYKDKCLVQYFRGGETVQTGRLARTGRGWHFEYGKRAHEDDEPFFKLDQHLLQPGLYVSLVEHDGVRRPFKIVSVLPEGINPSNRRA